MAAAANQAAAPPSAAPSRRQGLAITGASLAGALSGYVVLAIVSRTLDLGLNAVFAAFWSALLVTYGFITGLNTETSRSVAAAHRGGVDAEASRPRVALLLVAAPVLVLVVGGAAAALGLHPFGADGSQLAWIVACSAAVYAGEAVLLGALAGRGAWSHYATLLTLEALTRLVLVAGSAMATSTLLGVAGAAAAAPAVWLLLVALSPRIRGVAGSRLGEGWAQFAPRAGSAVLAAGASGVLVVGFPLMLSATTPPDVYAGAAAFMFAITLTRAPIMVPLTAFQSVVVSHFVRHPDRAPALLVRIVLALLGLGVVGAAAAFAVGPWLMTVLFTPEFWVAGWVLAVMTFASAGTGVVMVTAAMCQATSKHVAFLAGWLLALAATIAILLLPLDLTARVVLALLIPPYLGAAVHAAALLRGRRATS